MAAELHGKTLGLLTDSVNALMAREALQALQEPAMSAGLALRMIEVSERDPVAQASSIERIARERQVDALIACHLPLGARQAALFIEAGIPLGYLAGRIEGIDWCMVDEAQGGYEAARHLVALGHHRIAVVSGPPVSVEGRLREDGFMRALKEMGAAADGRQVKIVHYGETEGYEAGHQIADLAQRPSAIFCAAGDITCLGLMAAFKERGLKIPRDISLMGYDGLVFTAHLDPPLCTVAQPLRNMAQKLMGRLIESLKQPGRVPQGELFEARLLLRSSTAYPPEGQALRSPL